MPHHPEGPPPWEEPDPEGDETPMQGQVRHHNLTARVPKEIGPGVFSNGVMILTGAFEVVIDFVLRLGEQQRVVARVVLPKPVGQQFVMALQENIQLYERRFGPLPQLPRPLRDVDIEGPEGETPPVGSAPELKEAGGASGIASAGSPPAPRIDDIYDELRLPDSMLSGRYANAVLIRHSGAEFCFDFITNVYPRSAVSSRVFLAAPHAAPFLRSLMRSLSPPPGADEAPELE